MRRLWSEGNPVIVGSHDKLVVSSSMQLLGTEVCVELAGGDKSRRHQALGQIGRARVDPDEPVFPDGEFGSKPEARESRWWTFSSSLAWRCD